MQTRIENTYFAGILEGETNVGGIIGFTYCSDTNKMALSNCFYINSITAAISNLEKNGVEPKSQTYMQEQEFVSDLNRYVSAYEGELELVEWKYNEGSYPTH